MISEINISDFQYIDNHIDEIDWNYVVKHEILNEDFIRRYITHFDNKTIEIILMEHPLSDEFLIELIQIISKITEEDKDELIISYDVESLWWNFVTTKRYLTEEFIDKYSEIFLDYLCMENIFRYQVVSEELLIKYWDFVELVGNECIAESQILSEEFIIKYLVHDKDNFEMWDNLSQFQTLSISFMDTYFTYLNKDLICEFQFLTEDFIAKHFPYLNHRIVNNFQKLSADFRNKHTIYEDLSIENNWLYKDIEYKKQQMNDIECECSDDYFYAYAMITKQGRPYPHSWKHLTYEIGKTYIHHADFTDSECVGNCGLLCLSILPNNISSITNVTYLKVKIHYEDVAHVYEDGKTIRCQKFFVVEKVI